MPTGQLATNGIDVPAGLVDMPKYKSHKTVWAVKINQVTIDGDDGTTDENPIANIQFSPPYGDMRINLRGKPTPQAGWYMVQYEDGYISFSPAEQFEKGNTLDTGEKNENLPHYTGYGWALKQVHNGSGICRVGWNGKGMKVLLQVPDDLSLMTEPYLYLQYADGRRIPWVPSQADHLAIDWELAL